MTIPFTYRIVCPNGMNYYGVRYAKDCKPADLWTIYFTSSSVIRELLNKYSKEMFIIEIRKIFKSKEEAINYEHRVLTRVAGKDNWLNKNIGGKAFFRSGPLDNATKLKISKSLTGHKQLPETVEKRIKANTGKKRSDESKKKSSESNIGKHNKINFKSPSGLKQGQSNGMLGKLHSEETKQKMSNDRQGHICTQETKDKISAATKGRIVSDETKEKLKLAWTRRKCED